MSCTTHRQEVASNIVQRFGKTTTMLPASPCGTAHDRARADQPAAPNVGVRRAPEDPRPCTCTRLRPDRNDPPRNRRLRGRTGVAPQQPRAAHLGRPGDGALPAATHPRLRMPRRDPGGHRTGGVLRWPEPKERAGRLPGPARTEATAEFMRSRRRTRSSPSSADGSRTSPARS